LKAVFNRLSLKPRENWFRSSSGITVLEQNAFLFAFAKKSEVFSAFNQSIIRKGLKRTLTQLCIN
jgi:beta-lactamase class D